MLLTAVWSTGLFLTSIHLGWLGDLWTAHTQPWLAKLR